MIAQIRPDMESMLKKLEPFSPEERDFLIRGLGGDDLPAGIIIAHGVSLEEYMAHYAADHCEWIEGYVIKMPGELKHNIILYYLHRFFEAYFELRQIGQVLGQPFVMRLPAFPRRRREPDLFIVLNTNPHELKSTVMEGPADICIEIVSQESVKRDYEEKFREYDIGGVGEYWIIDSLTHDTRFYRRDEDGKFILQPTDSGDYQTPMLPGLTLHIPTLWQEKLPGPAAISQQIAAMLKDQE